MKMIRSACASTGLLVASALAAAPMHSPNLLRNTTFKQCTVGNQPDFWTAIYGTRSSLSFAEKWKGEYFQVCDDSPVAGAKSVRMIGAMELRSTQVTLQNGRPYAFSCYLKSDQEAHEVKIEVGHYDKRNPTTAVTVGRQWERHSVSGVVHKGTWFAAHWQVIIVHIYSRTEATLWVAAPQLEFGEEISPYRPADADGFVASEIEKHVEFPVTTSTEIKGRRPPTIEEAAGVRAARKKMTGPLVSDHDAGEIASDHATHFRVMHDEYNLYVYVRCEDPDLAKWQPRFKPTAVEWQKVLYDNSVILYVKPDFYDEDHFVLGVTPGGERMDTYMYRFSWENADWKAQTHLGKDYWAARFTVPFHAILQIAGKRAIGETLGINIRRLRATAATAEAKGLRPIDATLDKGIWHWSRDRFTRLPGAFGKLKGIDTKQVRACRIKDARLALAGADRIDALVDIDHVPALDEEAFLRVELVHAEGDSAERIMPFALDGQPRMVRIKDLGSKWRAGDWRLAVTIEDAAARTVGKTTQRFYVPETFRLPDNDLLVTVERSYYTTEKEARLLIESKVETQLALDIAREGEPARKLTDQPLVLPPRGRTFFPFALDEIPEGRHRIAVTSAIEVEKRGKTQKQVVARAYASLTKLSPAPEGETEVKLDRLRRILLVDGKPLIPMVMGIVDAERFHASYVRPGRGKGRKGRPAPDPMEPIKKAGLMAVPWGGGWGNLVNMEQFVATTRKSGVPLLGWMYHDEPSWQLERKLQEQYRKCKELDPYHPTFFLPATMRHDSLHRGPAGMTGASDIFCKSGYPWGMNSTHYTLGQTHYYSLQYWTMYTRKIGVVVHEHGIIGGRNLGTWAGNDVYRLSTPQHNRCLVYTGLANGLRYFSWWPGRPQSDLLWDGLIDLKKELDELAPILGDSAAIEEDYGERDRVQYALWSIRGKGYLIVANPWVESRTFTYQIPNVSASVRPLSENDKPATLKDGVLSISLEPYDCGLYELSKAGQ